MKIKAILHFAILIIVMGCDTKPSSDSLSKLSPIESVNLYFKCCDNGDTDTLKKIIYFAPETTEAQIQERVDALNTKSNSEVSTMLGFMGMNFKAKYEKIIDNHTAEVGVICKGGLLTGNSSTQVPAYQLILEKEDGVWKYYANKSHYTLDELAKMIRKNPNDASLYYYYGFRFISENPYKTRRYYKKYYELEPDGFWITREFTEDLIGYESVKSFEKMMLSCDAPPGNMSGVYTKIGLAFAENNDYEKANQYYEKAGKILKKSPNPSSKERLLKAMQELKFRKDGKHTDLLDEIEVN